MIIGCNEINDFLGREQYHCNSCHDDDGMGYEMCEDNPDNNRNGKESEIHFLGCCEVKNAWNREREITRTEWARMLRFIRNKSTSRGGVG